MISSPLLLGILITLVASLWNLARHPWCSRIFQVLPLPFWCYILPMAATTFGWLPAVHPLYLFLSKQMLPLCLVLLLIGADLRGLARLGPTAISLMLAGSLGTIAGGLISLQLYRHWLPADSWAAVGALSASWIGGSANLLAVKEALHLSDALVGPIIIVDALVAYSWMALLLWASTLQDRWQQLLEATSRGQGSQGRLSRPASGTALCDGPRSPALICRRGSAQSNKCWDRARSGRRIRDSTAGILLGLGISWLAQFAGDHLPPIGQVVNAQTWSILLVTTAALGLSFTPLRQLEERGLSKVGTFFLYLLLASIGARASFQAIAEAPIFLLLGVTWILIHGLTLLLAGLLFKAPLGLMACASQANIGGPISAPIVGATYAPQLATVGLLMAVLGNVLGTYAGLATAYLGKIIFIRS